MSVTTICARCGEPFEQYSNKGLGVQSYCSQTCRNIAAHERQVQRRAKQKKKTKKQFSHALSQSTRSKPQHAEWECVDCGADLFSDSQPDKCGHCGSGSFRGVAAPAHFADPLQMSLAGVRSVAREARAAMEAVGGMTHRHGGRLAKLLGKIESQAHEGLRLLVDAHNPDEAAAETLGEVMDAINAKGRV